MKEYLTMHIIALAGGALLDMIAGDPHFLWHPVRAVGALITFLEKRLYPDGSKIDDRALFLRGILLFVTVLTVTAAVSFGVLVLCLRVSKTAGIICEMIMTYFILAAGSLRDESMAVYRCFGRNGSADLEPARKKLSMIVGRDTERLDEEHVAKAAVETVAENTSDGVIAPFLYTIICPALGMCYKAVNTMDSMIGYKNSRYEYFGKCAAKADDMANFVPSRISAVLLMAATAVFSLVRPDIYSLSGAFRIYRRDRLAHKSPNSAQTESVCAGALGLRLGGDNYYNGCLVRKPFIGDERRKAVPEDIKRAVKLMFGAHIICMAVMFTVIKLILICL